MYAIIETGGKQYQVKQGDIISVEKLNGDVGSDIVLDTVLLYSDTDNDTLKIGTPALSDVTVSAQIQSQTKAGKITVFKSKRRKGYHKKQGHRQLQTKLLITNITVS